MSGQASQAKVKTLERGNIYFFYRPRVEEEDPQGKSDLQRLYMLLNPNRSGRYRLIVIGQKHLPDPQKSGRQRQWAFVDRVRQSPREIRRYLEDETYSTKTRGERHLPAARAAGEGVYRILRHEDHTHLVYSLELPTKTGEVQEGLEIEPEASYIASIANPERGSARAPGLSKEQRAEFPKKLKDRFRDRKFADVDPPDFLDYEGAELILISADEDISEELGIELDTERETTTSAEIFRDLHIDKSDLPTEPLLSAKWE